MKIQSDYFEELSPKVFKRFVDFIFEKYKGYLESLESVDAQHNQQIKKILNETDICHLKRGLNKLVFGLGKESRRDKSIISIGAFLRQEHEENKIPKDRILISDFGDYLYKRINSLNQGRLESGRIPYHFLYALGFDNLDGFLSKYGLNNVVEDSFKASQLADGLVGKWYMYYYNNETERIDDEYFVRAVVKIHGLHEIELINHKASDRAIDYIGRVDQDTVERGIIRMEFSPKNNPHHLKKDLIMTMYFNSSESTNMCIGRYLNIDNDQKLISGTFLMVKRGAQGHEDDLDHISFSYSEGIDEGIGHILEFIRFPENKFTLLPEWNIYNRLKLELLQSKPNRLSMASIKHGMKGNLFISVPSTSVVPELQDNENLTQELNRTLGDIVNYLVEKKSTVSNQNESTKGFSGAKKTKFKKVHCKVYEKKTLKLQSSDEPSYDFPDMVNNLKTSTHHMVIWTNNFTNTGVLLEIGMSLADQRPIVIFQQESEGSEPNLTPDLPFLVKGAKEYPKCMLQVFKIKSLEDILQKIISTEAKGKDIFDLSDYT